MKIQIVVFDGVDEIDFAGPYEIFRHVAMIGKKLETTLVTLEPKQQVTAQHGLRFLPDGLIQDECDMLMIPGGGYVNQAGSGVRQEIKRGIIQKKINEFYKRGIVIAGVCTGGMALAAAGILKGRVATTHAGALKDLHQAGAQALHARIVDIGDILTCGGVTSSLDLALWIVERSFDAETADRVSKYIEHVRSRDVHISK